MNATELTQSHARQFRVSDVAVARLETGALVVPLSGAIAAGPRLLPLSPPGSASSAGIVKAGNMTVARARAARRPPCASVG